VTQDLDTLEKMENRSLDIRIHTRRLTISNEYEFLQFSSALVSPRTTRTVTFDNRACT